MQEYNIFRAYRIKSGFTQCQLADLLDVDQTTISKWENGIAYPHVAVLLQFSRLVRADPRQLFDGIVKMERQKARHSTM